MRISKFLKHLITLIIFLSLVILSFSINIIFLEEYFSNSMIMYTIRIIFMILFLTWTLLIKDEYEDVFVLKYKIIEDSWSTKVKCLKLGWLFVPYWSSVETVVNSYEYQNIFGAKYNHVYNTEKKYNNKEDATIAINEHKEKIKKNRIEYFKKPDKNKKIKKVTYI